MEALGRKHVFYADVRTDLPEWYQKISLHCIQTDFKHDYQVTDILGKGAFSTVYKGLYLQKFQHVAVKSIMKETIARNPRNAVFAYQ